ncbi:hypothetical protein I4F81_006016 [Pyropia yezoensis]|uniref:Uncharacterized protein n=1 Tax=Pyropia yezoensis TaxID=2788 RepID=A0ACC3BZJ4_PYRYE|nr:hypothetical protein I4F81_006016 [Neopyropia yezoensis]
MHDLARPEGGLFHVEVKANNVPMQCDSASTCGRLRWANTTYALLDIHAHVPAEHQLNGRSFPLELHAVHVSADTQEIAVVGMLFDYLGAPHPLLQRLLDAKAAETNVTVAAGEWDNVMRPESGFCHLEGSLTTPPCTEGLNWFLQTDVLSVSRVQVSAFAAIRGEGPAAGNARPLQDTNGREVVQHTESRLHHHAECCCTRDDQGKPTVAQLELVDRPVSMMETWSGLGMTRAQPDVPRDSRGWLDRDFKCLMF